MILADKIINERKKNGWSQEELADKLSVSRQSVSKWEGAQSVPDLNRIVAMADLFNVSIDYLLKDEIEPEENVATPVDSGSPMRKLTMEEAGLYLKTVQKNNAKAVIGTISFILCPVVMIFLAGLSDAGKFGITENMAAGIGLLFLAIFISLGIILWINVEGYESPFKFLQTEDFDSVYGVSGMVKEQMKKFEPKYSAARIVSILFFIFSPAALIGAALMEASDFVIVSMLCVLLFMVAAGVGILVYNGRIMNSYETLLNEKKDREQMKRDGKMKIVNTIYWCSVTALFLAMGMGFNLWQYAGVFWAVAGVLYCVVLGIAKLVINRD